MAKQPKLITCKHCGQQIAASAKVCPHCGGKNKKPVYKRAWFWVLIVIVLFVIIGGSGGSKKSSDTQKVGEVSSRQGGQNTEPAKAAVKEEPKTEKSDEKASDKKDKEEETAAAEEQPEENVQTIYKVGDILHDGNTDIVYVSSGDYKEDNQFMQPGEGNKYIFLNFAFINTSDKSDSTISFYSFECYADGYNCEAYYGGDDDLSATLSAGRSTQGSVYFEVPADAAEIEIEYEPNILSQKKIVFAYEGDKDSGYVLEKNTAATEGALKAGESVESDKLNMTYLSCKKDQSDNMFITPKDGYHYITCEFEFENVSKSDLSVSAFSFDCYADGVSCDGAFFRDDAISGTMSPGRKSKGTVTFEVPDGAMTVEVEYLSNIWTSNRVVFDASGI